MRKNSILAKVLMLCVLSSGTMAVGTVYANQIDNERGQHKAQSWRKNLTDEQRKEIRSLREVSQERTRGIKEQLFVKKQELKALQNATNPDVSAVKSVAEEMVSLRSQMHQERKNLAFSIDKALGLEPGTTFQRMGQGRKFAENGRGKGRHGKNNQRKQQHRMGVE